QLDADHFLMWQVEFPNNRIIPRRFGRREPIVGDVSMIGFSIRTDLISRVRFKNKKGGDYLMIKLLSEHLEPVWIQQILTKINYIQNRTIGSGKQNDLHFSVAQISEYKLFLENKMKRQTQRRNITIVKR